MTKYPDFDEKLKLVESQVQDLDHAIVLCKQKRVAIQAGGAVGVWPQYLSKHFDKVCTFEPSSENFACLVENVTAGNVHKFNAAIGFHGNVEIQTDHFERNNAGAGYTVPGSTIESYAIDDVAHRLDVDLIQLDIEGNEWQAILGGIQTILRCKPVIMLEEKPLPHAKNHEIARKILELFGYKVRKRINRDVILSC